MTTTPATIARILVDDSEDYDRFRRRFNSEFEYYRRVRNAAPQTLENFEEFLTLHQVFFDKSQGDSIKSWVEENLARSLKNMVLKTSPRGQAYPVSTLAEVRSHLQAYNDIGLETPGLDVVVDTVIEALFNSADGQLEPEARDVFTDLLATKPPFERIGGAVDQLARLKVVHSLKSNRLSGPGTTPDDDLEMAAREYVAATSRPTAPEGATACYEAARGIQPGNPKKRKLLAAAVHQDPTTVEAMWDFLYWSARATIEQFRHRDARPTLGSLYCARYQMEVVASYSDAVDKPETWTRRVDAYKHVADGIECGQGRFTTTRENWPEVDFEQAAESYESAAEEIEPIDTSRCLKYQSKAFRYRAHAADNEYRTYRIHGEAIDWLLSTTSNKDITEFDEIRDLLCQHHVRRLEYDINRSFADRDFEAVIRQHVAYHTVLNSVSLVTRRDEVVDACYHLAKAIRSLDDDNPQRTKYHYQCATDLELPCDAEPVRENILENMPNTLV